MSIESSSHDSLTSIDLAVSGMTCAACAGRVEKALQKLPAVHSAQVNLATERATVQLRESGGGAASIISAIERAGYGAKLVQNEHAIDTLHAADWRLWLAAICALPFLAAMFVHVVNVYRVGETGASSMNHWLAPLWQVVLASMVQFIAAAPIYTAAYKAIRAGSGNMDVLVVIGTSAAWLLSVINLWLSYGATTAALQQGPALYFESSALVIAFVLFGRWLERRARRRTLDALAELAALRPDSATRRLTSARDMQSDQSSHSEHDAHNEAGVQNEQGFGSERVPVSELKVGDLIEVAPGERIAVDGVIVQGQSSIDQALLTGEPLPLDCGVGDSVATGAINRDGVLLVKARAVGQSTLLAGVIRAVAQAQTKKAPIQALVDRVTSVFVPLVLLLAIATLLGWGIVTQNWSIALLNAIAVLVIACPCALGLATPAALMAGTGAAARAGILIKDVSVLGLARRVQTVAFDKTGTLTLGQASVEAFVALADVDERRAVALSAALLAASEHPLAAAVRQYTQQLNLSGMFTAHDTRAHPGQGFSGQVRLATDVNAATGALEVLIGNRTWFEQSGIDVKPLNTTLQAWSSQGHTVSLLAVNRQLLGAFAFGDTLKPNAAQCIEQLHGRGLQTLLLSGDQQAVVQRVAKQLNMGNVRAEQLPADKARVIAQWPNVAMVGDGINDAAALAQADIGIAMLHADAGDNARRGADLVMASADITLMRSDLTLVPAALDIAIATERKIRQNLFWAFAYNVVGLPLAAFGKLDPVWAGLAMALSSVCVVSNSLWLSRWRPTPLDVKGHKP